ncbi:hypothetical protein ILUMI_23725 [Ignelater luminosus]|uniref:Uncharacterized protein n=1 Tax=Ignelater luminosus TaxID=2038154 RepID=A0A8K0C895_IGNLU|nr:hypothetical protein ILUMI_23725 [Ignelater luminosus]
MTRKDFDPKVIEEFEEQHPVGIPLSYILRYSQSHSRQAREVVSADVRLRLYQHASKSVGERHNAGT